VAKTNGAVVRRVLEGLFQKHGTPLAMLMDNGAPWVSTRSRAGLTRLSAWLVTLGIKLHRSRPGSPQDNGGHERMHRDLNELRLLPARSRRSQQPLCDRWALDFNHLRPHQALDDRTPAEVYGRPSPRLPVARVPVYPAGCITRRVLSSGEITLNGDRVVIGRALAGQLVGLRYESGLRWRAWFFESDLGTIEIAGHDLIDTELVQSADVVPAATVAIPVNPNEGHQTVTPVSARSPENVSAMS
jgi:putative transposase